MAALLRQARAGGFGARDPHEGPLDYLGRVARDKPALAAQASEIIALYIDARYGPGVSPSEQRRLARLVREFRAA